MTTDELISSLHWDELNAKPVRVLWTSERLDSLIALLELTGNREVILKQHRPETDAIRSAGTRACYEHDVLVSLRAAMTGDYSVPRPLLVDKPLGAVVIEKAIGRPLDELIRERKRTDAGAHTLAPLVARAGTWLRLMQQHTRSSEDPQPLLRRVFESALADLDAISAHDWLIRRRRNDIAAALRTLGKRVQSGVAGHHGDYWPGNIFLDDTRVEVIDFEGYRLGLPIEDVAYFLVQLELLLPRHPRRLPPLRDAFLDAYYEGAPRDDDALRLFTLTKTLYALSRPPGASHVLPLRLWLRHMQRRIACSVRP
ncbi:MAG: aminoglycoside phosphotransferase family protein [Thermoanaerobaculia bacterium]